MPPKPKPIPTSTDLVEFVPDLVFSKAKVFSKPNGKDLLLDLYLPKEAIRPLPVIIWLHGGGWRFGDRRLCPNLAKYFAESGFAMASIDYRLSDEAIFPAQIHDVKAAIRWLRAHAEDYGLDKKRFGLWGTSAGAHLGSIVALVEETGLEPEGVDYPSESVSIQAVVDGYGPTDFSQMDAHRNAIPIEDEDPESIRVSLDKLTADADSFESKLLGAAVGDRPDLVKIASPLNYVRSGAPPFLILHGLSDGAVPAHQSELLYEALAEHENDVTLYLVEGLGHGFLNRDDFDKPVRLAHVRETKKSYNEHSKQERLTFGTIATFFTDHLK